MRIGFWKEEITPDPGVELGGYAGYRPCARVHDPLWCRAVVLEQEGQLYGLIQLDLMCADAPFCARVARMLAPLGIEQERLLVTAIHSHSAPCGVVPGEGLMKKINLPGYPADENYLPYLETVMGAVYAACEKAVAGLEDFTVRTGWGTAPRVGSERHTADDPNVMLTAVQCRTESGKVVTVYNFPCHPTIMGPGNLEVTADFAAGIEGELKTDMAVFLNGAAGDISTRYTRSEQTFSECQRLGKLAADRVREVLEGKSYRQPEPLKGVRGQFAMAVRPVEPMEEAQKRLEELTEMVKQAQAQGADARTIRTLKSYAEGAGINLQFAKGLGDTREIWLDICAFCFAGVKFATIPGELFSTLLPEDACVIGYANGYNLYIADEMAYEKQYYEALASLFARGEGEKLMEFVNKLLTQLEIDQSGGFSK